MTATTEHNDKYHLISHVLCPYVQRVVIVLLENRIKFRRSNIELSNKPKWFLQITPLEKTPVLLVRQEPIFESAVICEYLDEVKNLGMIPSSPYQKAMHRSWIEFGNSVLNEIVGLYNAKDWRTFDTAVVNLKAKLGILERELLRIYNQTDRVTLLDVTYAPIFRYFHVFDKFLDIDWLGGNELLMEWERKLFLIDSVQEAVDEFYETRLIEFLKSKNSHISTFIT